MKSDILINEQAQPLTISQASQELFGFSSKSNEKALYRLISSIIEVIAKYNENCNAKLQDIKTHQILIPKSVATELKRLIFNGINTPKRIKAFIDTPDRIVLKNFEATNYKMDTPEYRLLYFLAIYKKIVKCNGENGSKICKEIDAYIEDVLYRLKAEYEEKVYYCQKQIANFNEYYCLTFDKVGNLIDILANRKTLIKMHAKSLEDTHSKIVACESNNELLELQPELSKNIIELNNDMAMVNKCETTIKDIWKVLDDLIELNSLN